MLKIILIFVFLFVLSCNIITAKFYSAKEMHDDFISGQCLVGKIAANIFYAPAWFLKGLRFIVILSIK